MANMLPLLVLGAGAVLLMKKKKDEKASGPIIGEGTTNPIPPLPQEDEVPTFNLDIILGNGKYGPGAVFKDNGNDEITIPISKLPIDIYVNLSNIKDSSSEYQDAAASNELVYKSSKQIGFRINQYCESGYCAQFSVNYPGQQDQLFIYVVPA